MDSKERGRNEPREEVSYIQVLEVQDMTMGTQTAILRGNPVGLVAILDSVFTILSLVSTLINVEKLPSCILSLQKKHFLLFSYRHELILVWFNIGNEDQVFKKRLKNTQYGCRSREL